MQIDNFHGEYFFLSNFSDSEVFIPSGIFPDIKEAISCKTVEHAYQALKADNEQQRMEIVNAETPSKCKKLGRKCSLREGFNDLRVSIMFILVRQKFNNNPKLAFKLIKTGNAELIEGNTWHDVFFGVCNGIGENNLGKILMEVRSEIRKYPPEGLWNVILEYFDDNFEHGWRE